VTIDPSHPFPHVINKALCVAFHLRQHSRPGTTYLGVVTVPRKLPRLVRIPSKSGSIDYIFLHDLIETHTRNLYKGYQVLSSGAFASHPQQQSVSARGRVAQFA
jgi:polyphosphate kinase